MLKSENRRQDHNILSETKELKSMFPYIPIITVEQIISFIVKCLKEAGEIIKGSSETLGVLHILQEEHICPRK